MAFFNVTKQDRKQIQWEAWTRLTWPKPESALTWQYQKGLQVDFNINDPWFYMEPNDSKDLKTVEDSLPMPADIIY